LKRPRHLRWHLAVGLWALLAAQPLLARAAEFQPFVFVHAGDPELGKPDVESTAARLALLGQRANKIGAALVIVAGDLTHGSIPKEVKAFEDALKQFTMPVKVVPGNHDTPEMFEKHFGKDHYVFTHNNCDFICMNSNRPISPSADPRREPQWKWLEEALTDARRQHRTHVFVVLHHPMANRSPLGDLLARHHVTAVLAGHLHTTTEIPCTGFTIYVAPGTARFRDRNGLGYRVFKVYADRFEQEFVPLESEGAR